MEYIDLLIKRLSEKHQDHIEVYGDNTKRLSGRFETSDINKFSAGVADRSASIRIPSSTAVSKRGYIEDRRPASNMNPYLVTAFIADTTILNEESKVSDMITHFKKWTSAKGSPNDHHE